MTTPHAANTEPSLAELGRLAARSLETTELEKKLKLTLNNRVYLARTGDVIGRQGSVALDQLVDVETISRRHVLIDYERGHWTLRVPAAVLNATRLDGVELPRDQAVSLAGKHILALGAAVIFTVEVIA
jgi:FHA domain